MAEVIPGIKPTQIKASTDMEPLADVSISGCNGFLMYMEMNWVDDSVHVTLGPRSSDPCFLVDATTNLMHIFCSLLKPALYTVTEHRLDTGSVADPSILLTMQLTELRAFQTVNLLINSQ